MNAYKNVLIGYRADAAEADPRSAMDLSDPGFTVGVPGLHHDDRMLLPHLA